MSNTINLYQKPSQNVGLFVGGWRETHQNTQFLKYVAPIYRRACKEGKKEAFFELLFPVWFDRFPVILYDGIDDDEGGVDPERIKWYMERQKKYLRTKMLWSGLFYGAEYEGPIYDDWECLLTLQADRERRREKYFEYAARGEYITGFEYHAGVVSPAERAKVEKHGDEHCRVSLRVLTEEAAWSVVRIAAPLNKTATCVINFRRTFLSPSGTQNRRINLTAMASQGKRKRDAKKRVVEEYLEPAATELAGPAVELTRHMDIEAAPFGFSVKHTVLEVPIPPSERHRLPSPVQYTWNGATPTHGEGESEDEDGIFSFECVDPDYEHEPINPSDEPSKRRRTTAMDNPLLHWTSKVNNYVQEFLRHEGLAGALLACNNDEHHTGPFYRCKDCVDPLEDHRSQPFHCIKEWNGSFFKAASLKDVGLSIPLGHTRGTPCLNWEAGEIVILHTNGIHTVAVEFCSCTQAVPRNVQLLRSQLFPATIVFPRTAATFALLESFQLLSFMSKASAFEFYQTLARLTDNTGLTQLPDRYPAFLRMIREWRHVKMLKRAARGHDANGVGATQPGECAVICPACPQPGINLPDNWRDAPPDKEWLYSLFVGIDANFRLKRLNVSSEEQDPGLNRGFAYFVENTAFKRHIAKYDKVIKEDTSTCNNHDAIKSASIRGGKGIDASGTGKTECARHDMKRPASVGDLQKGERYVNMDYFFFSSLKQNSPRKLIVSYDIACQWARYLKDRASTYGDEDYPRHEFVFLVPKFHLPAHRPECHVNFSFNFTRHVGRTDGEAPERGWAAINAVSNSTKEMGPGSRRDTLDDHFGDYNWRKVMTIPSTFRRKAEEAIAKRAEHVSAFEAFNAALPESNTVEWLGLVEAWEKDGTRPNPFAANVQKISENAVRLEMAEEDAVQMRENLTAIIHRDVPPSRLIAQGLELEDHQRILRIDNAALGGHSTDLQRSKILERGNRLFRKIEAWTSIQTLYMPHVATIRAEDDRTGGSDPPSTINMNLYLPSSIIDRIPCDPKFVEYEWRLRFAQAHGTLNDIRRGILLRSQMWKSKDKLVSGQRLHTRSHALLAKAKARVDAATEKYRQIYDALTILARHLLKIGWDNDLRPLTDADIRGITADEDELSEGRRSISWIWRMSSGVEAMDDEGKQEALRIEWCKARARGHRWGEECLLLEEEMRRVIAFYTHKQAKWARLASARYVHVDNVTADGLQAYAARQADLQRRLLTECIDVWGGLSMQLLIPSAP
ncbi:hypothetical protein DXG01_007524 [Tephrocybe rancida]|nr:hypothetical protein DXG01_007524 [Tephrocybe rancida]